MGKKKQNRSDMKHELLCTVLTAVSIQYGDINCNICFNKRWIAVVTDDQPKTFQRNAQ